MMNQQPDKLFRDKLESYQRPAPASAWDRIDAGLDKRNKIAWPWLKIAAALLLIAISLWIFWPKKSSIDTPQTADKENVTPKKDQPTPTEKPSLEKQQAVIAPTEKQDKTKTVNRQHAGANKNLNKEVEEEKREERKKTPSFDEPAPTEDIAANEEKVTQEMIASSKSSREENIKIVFTANDAEKYLVKKSTDEATTDAKKQSRFQKLLDKAEDLTTNQDPIGEIRQVKNEILALNFRSEKDRGQNK